MQTPSQSENQRDSYRCPTDKSRQEAQMRFGDTWIPVELLDESAGGLGVRAECMPQVKAGDKVSLRCGEKCFEVEIMHVTQCPHADGSQDENAGEPACKLGVRRISEVFQQTDTRTPLLRQIMGNRHRPPFSFDGKGLGLGLAIAFLVGVLPAAAVISLGPSILDSRASNSTTNDNGFTFGSRSSNPKPVKIKSGGEVDGSLSAGGEGILPAKPSLSERQQGVLQSLLDHAKLQVNIEPWTDAMLALLNKLVQQMGLSDLQQVESAQLLEYTDQSLANLDAGENQKEFAQKRLSLLEEAYASLIHLFSETQQDEWDKLVEKQGEAVEDKN